MPKYAAAGFLNPSNSIGIIIMSEYNTLRQRRLKQTVKHSKDLLEAATKAGYSPKSKTVYQQRSRTNSIVREAFKEETEEEIRSDFSKAKDICLKSGDISNYLRANEDLARIKAMFTDKSISKIDLTTQEEANIVDRYIKQSRLDAVKLT